MRSDRPEPDEPARRHDARADGDRGRDGDEFVEIVDGDVTWRVETGFLRSSWTCIYGRGCQGILDHPAPELHQGCCSVGAHIDGIDEAMTLAASADAIPAHLWQHRDARDVHGVFSDETRSNTKIVDGACIFLNRPGFEGGIGCALHLAARAAGESPIDWKPSVCWQLPLHVDWSERADGGEVATMRRWSRDDWQEDGETMAWWCTEAPEAYVGEVPVIESLAEELAAITGDAVAGELRRRLL